MKVTVIVPIYRSQLPHEEQAALKNNAARLKAYPMVLLAPEGLDIGAVEQIVPTARVVRVSDEWLGRKNGIAGYNAMMLSEAFYRLFAQSEYILICHTDAWIFRDDLAAWCDKGYDCVAAPWVRRKIYDLPLVKQYMNLRLRFAQRTGKPSRQKLYGRIGNGGLTLRHTAHFAEACRLYKTEIQRHLAAHHHLFNEDVFWATVPEGFRYPTWEEALDFSFDTNPAYCYKMQGNRLPMGCHSWNKKRMWKFWKRFIPVEL